MMLDRTSAPPFVPINTFSLPEHKTESLNGDTPVYLYNQVNQDVLKIELVFKASTWNEIMKGLSYFTVHMLEKGTRSKNAFEIANHFERYGASIELIPGFDLTSVSLYTLSKNLKDVLPQFIELITDPVFNEDELQLMKNIYLSNLKINNEKTSYLASKYFKQNLFGEHHPYGGALEEEDVHAITALAVKQYFEQYYQLESIFLTGKMDAPALNYALKELETIPHKKAEIKVHTLSAFPEKLELRFQKRGSVQASLRMGKRTINRRDPDYANFILLNHILGGYFGSRLMKNIREEKGLTYGIYSSINVLRQDSFFLIGADVNQDNLSLAIDEIGMEIEKLRREEIDLDEFSTARNHLLGSLQSEVANPFAVIEKIKTIKVNQLEPDYYNQLFANILNATPADLKSVANRNLSPPFLRVSVN